MKAGPGKTLFLLLFLSASALIGASDYRYSLHISKTSLYVKEPMTVVFDINQTDSSKVMYFDFNIEKSEDFFIHRLKKVVDEGYHDRKERYIYLVYPLKNGEHTMRFDLVVRRGNDDLLTTAFTGGRYNVKAVETEDRHEQVPSKKIDVKPLPKDVDIVGRFKVYREIERQTVQSYEPLYLDVKVSGTGFAPDIEKREWLPPIPGVKLFSDKPKITLRYTKEGILCEALFRYALIAQKDYKIPRLYLQAFDTTQKEPYEISDPSIKIHVKPVDTSLLLDKKSSPPPAESPFVWIKKFLIAFLIFAAGWVSALLVSRLRAAIPVNSKNEVGWKELVESSENARELLKLLVIKDAAKYETVIEKLERGLYKGEKIDLKRIKKEVLNED